MPNVVTMGCGDNVAGSQQDMYAIFLALFQTATSVSNHFISHVCGGSVSG